VNGMASFNLEYKPVNGSYKRGNETAGFNNIRRISQMTSRLLTSQEGIICFVYGASLYNLFQMKPTWCILLLSILISASLPVSGNYVSIIRRTYCMYATLCRIDTASSHDNGHIVARNM